MLLAHDQLESREFLMQLKLADYPAMTADDRSKLHKTTFKKAFPANEEKVHSFDNFEKALGL